MGNQSPLERLIKWISQAIPSSKRHYSLQKKGLIMVPLNSRMNLKSGLSPFQPLSPGGKAPNGGSSISGSTYIVSPGLSGVSPGPKISSLSSTGRDNSSPTKKSPVKSFHRSTTQRIIPHTSQQFSI